jgi:hypothetical protein
MRTTTILFLLVGFAGCAKGIDPPVITEMVYFRGTAANDPLEFLFGDDEGCPKPECIEDAVVGEVFPTVLAKVAPFALDVHEVTNRQYEYCVELGACEDLAGYNLASASIESYHRNAKFNDHPVVNVTAVQAAQYCAFAGEQEGTVKPKRLPTEVEWEYAIRGAGKNTGGWPLGATAEACDGKEVQVQFCNGNVDRPRAVGSDTSDLPDDDAIAVSGVGTVYDLVGNVSEWLGHGYDPYITCDESPEFVEQCGSTCEEACGDDGDCRTDCRRCPYCDVDAVPAGLDTCFMVCGDLAMCVEKPASGFIPTTYAFLDDQRYMYRGGNFRVNKDAGDATQFGICTLRTSSRNKRMTKTQSADWLGFRCAMDL